MRRTLARITLTAAATAGLAATTWVQALGLGEINVDSNLNQRFVASIPLTEINAEDLETVTVSVAPNEAFDRAGIERADYLTSLNFEIKNDRGRPRVLVTSNQIAREPVLNLLVQARWSGGKILRDYTILLDPPEVVTRAAPAAAPAPVIAATPIKPAPVVAAPKSVEPAAVPVGAEFYEPTAEPKPAVKPVKPAAAPVASKPSTAPPAAFDASFDSATGSYGPVAPKETLWSIATKVRPSPAVSMDQVLLALSEANPVAIQRGTTVSKGVTLRVPSAERIQATPAAVAKIRLAALRNGGKPSAATAKPAVPVSKPAAPKPASPAPAAAPVIAAPKPAAPQPAAPAPAPAATEKPAAPPSTTETKRPELPKPQLALPPKSEAPAPAAPAAAPTPAPAPAPAPVVATTASGATAPASPPASPTPAEPAAPATAATSAPTSQAGVATPEPAPATGTAPAAPAEAVATPPPAEPVAPVPAKAPLAQPLPAEPEESLLSTFGLPLALLVLALGGGLFWLSKRSKQKNPGAAGSTPFKPGDTSSVAAPAAGGGAAGKLGDTTRLSGTQSLGPKATGAMLAADATQQMLTPQVDQITTQTGGAKTARHDSTLSLDPEVAASLNSSVKHSAVTGGEANFDKTTQVHVDTLHISLDDNDPLAEADFHLAYGLYDEAILLLMTATRQQPERIELKVKLAETYFAAGRPLEFQEVAEDLHGQLPPAEWSKIAIMGAQICPDVALFQSSDDSGMAADFDLAFDEPEAAAPPAPAPAPVATPAATSNSIDFSLSVPAAQPDLGHSLMLDDDDQPGQNKKQDTPAPSPSSFDDEASIDFMLGQSLTPLGAGLKVPEPSAMPFNFGTPTLNIEPSHHSTLPTPSVKDDLLKDDLLEISELSDSPTIAPPAGDMLSFSLQDLEVSITPRNITGGSKEDEFNTKLDLARAYVEMGDNDMARGLLLEVQSQGGERQQQEANTLLQRLPA